MKTKIDIGKTGEARAAHYLRRNGYRILEKNFKNRLGEIDLVAEDGGVICFVEVRTRRGTGQHERALASVDSRKQQRLSRMAVSFLKQRGLLERRARFDVMSVIFDEGPEDILLLKDAFSLNSRYAI